MIITLDYEKYQEMETTIKGLREENDKLREDHVLYIIKAPPLNNNQLDAAGFGDSKIEKLKNRNLWQRISNK